VVGDPVVIVGQLVSLSSTEGPLTARVWPSRDRWGEVTGAVVWPLRWPATWTLEAARDQVRQAILDGRIDT
jgi:hypothetical protein